MIKAKPKERKKRSKIKTERADKRKEGINKLKERKRRAT